LQRALQKRKGKEEEEEEERKKSPRETIKEPGTRSFRCKSIVRTSDDRESRTIAEIYETRVDANNKRLAVALSPSPPLIQSGLSRRSSFSQ
jgi:hypothetical protein